MYSSRNSQKRDLITYPVCPWCGSNGYPQRYHMRNGRPRSRSFRVAKKKVQITHSKKSLGRYALDSAGRPHMRGPASRTRAVCSHPFHEQFEYSRRPEPPTPRPARVHNPDLTERKALLHRDLQGKHRR